MNYGYCRVSARDQNLSRQFEAMNTAGVEVPYIFIDKESGKNFDRVGYQSMKKRIRSGDCIFVQSLDRFGRNYTEIMEEWRDIISRGVDIVVLDMEILDTRTAGRNGLVGRFVSDLVLQVLAFVAEQERLNIRERQRQGIKLARLQGKKFGRPSSGLPENFHEVAQLYEGGGNNRNGSSRQTRDAEEHVLLQD